MNDYRSAVEELIYDTCMKMDAKDFPGYLALCDPGFEYRLSAYSPEIQKEMTWLDHNRTELEELFNTLPKHNSDPNPLTRNAIVYKVAFDETRGQANAVTAFQIYKTALDGGVTELFAVGKYYDTIKLNGGEPKLLRRHARLDTRSLSWGYHIPF